MRPDNNMLLIVFSILFSNFRVFSNDINSPKNNPATTFFTSNTIIQPWNVQTPKLGVSTFQPSNLPTIHSCNHPEYSGVRDTTKTHPGKKAAILSAILPGLGQASNKKYWKIPIIYALGATTLYYVDYHNKRYEFFRDAFICKTDTLPCTDDLPLYVINQVKILKDEHRRNRDWFIILSCAVYALNIIDASVDAHLLDFDITDDLSLSIQPGIFQNYYSGISGGLSLKLSF